MSSASVTLAKRNEKVTLELTQELEAIRAMNSSLKTYLENLRSFKKNLVAVHSNFGQLAKVNSQWVNVLKNR